MKNADQLIALRGGARLKPAQPAAPPPSRQPIAFAARQLAQPDVDFLVLQRAGPGKKARRPGKRASGPTHLQTLKRGDEVGLSLNSGLILGPAR